MSPDSCPFCLIAAGQAPAAELERSIFSGLHVLQFRPLSPVTSGHLLFIPLVHLPDAAAAPHAAAACFEAAATWGDRQRGDFNLITSSGRAATQTVHHLHVHYVPRRGADGLHLPWTGQVREMSQEATT